MAIPVYLQQFKAAGIYRVVFDKSTVLNTDTQILRLVVGYSEKGPFNIPVYVKDTATFKQLFGDISKKLEKRGIFFHRLALQMLQTSPILCLNLKKFENEQVSGATINTQFNPVINPIEDVKLSVEQIYDTTRFWELNAEKLNNLKSDVDGSILDQYINICTTNTKNTSATYFIRKASGAKISSYNLTLNDWYSNDASEMPEYLEKFGNNLVSDYMAEIYVFKGKFTAKQVLASDTLKNYFVTTENVDEDGSPILQLRDHVVDAFGEWQDTLDALYNDETSNAIGHWTGSLIPYFKNKQGAYDSLDIAFNNDQDTHNMMMSFNVDLLYESDSPVNIDLSGRASIPTNYAIQNKLVSNQSLSLPKLFLGTAESTVLGNVNAPVISDIIKFKPNVYDGSKAIIEFSANDTRISGTMYVTAVTKAVAAVGTTAAVNGSVKLQQVGDTSKTITLTLTPETQESILNKLGVPTSLTSGDGTYYTGDAFTDTSNPLEGPEKCISAISRLEKSKNADESTVYTDADNNMKVNLFDIEVETTISTKNSNIKDSIYGSSVSFIDFNDDNWDYVASQSINGTFTPAIVCKEKYDKSLMSVLQVGDCLLAADGLSNDSAKDNYYDNVFVNAIDTEYYDEYDDEVKNKTKNVGDFKFYYIALSNKALVLYTAETTEAGYTAISTIKEDIEYTNKMLVRIDAAINREIGTMIPQYLEGYTFENAKPEGTGMYAKVQWQNLILSALTDYKGLRTGLLNTSEINYRYVIDTFESYPVSGLKNVLSYLCKEKQSAFCISNFPSVPSFVKCPYTSFTDSKGIFDVNFVVAGYNKKKAAAIKFGLPADSDGASFIAFYSPLKFSDGYIDDIIPSAGLVSNLFINKYMSRQPYYIVAGPNYGSITASGLVGPDYKYSNDELQIIEPFGVNVMVYKTNFGTFINANQTAKQTPVSSLSKVNVRELVIYLQDEIEKVLQAYQWEFNNSTTRNAILDKANTICALVKCNGGIQAYKNTMDESNNTPEIIDNEMAILSTAIEPGFGCGKMVQELTLYRTGQLSSLIKEKN